MTWNESVRTAFGMNILPFIRWTAHRNINVKTGAGVMATGLIQRRRVMLAFRIKT